MSQVLKSVSGTGSLSPQGLGISKPVMGPGSAPGSSISGLGGHHGQSQTQNMLSSPTAGMPGVLPGNILHGHGHKSVSMATVSMGCSNTNYDAASSCVLGVASKVGQQQQALTSTNQQTDGAALNLNHLANTKEKTPMCLINELARFNKIQHTYTLTDEQGPAHKKVFFVKLKLGDEEYPANGPSIKKAQHAAAATALESTQYKHPPPKPPRNPTSGDIDEINDQGNPSITPTVELNALAMKLGQPAIYRPLEPARNNFYPPNLNFRGMYNQRYHQPRYPRTFYVSLKVGQREFIGEGNTRQAARHNAADKALKVLSVLPITSDEVAKASSAPPKDIKAEESEDDETDTLKSEISLVHEIALKRNMHVNFEVTKESGPPHMKTFVTCCTCGTLATEGEGNSKKLSKKRAAEKMMEALQGLPTINSVPNKAKKNPNKKKNNRNIIKKADPDYGVGINPISRLIQIQQAKKEKEPVYTLLAEKGMPRRKEFVMQVSVGDQMCTGVGPNKKLAKRNAAESMLQMLGYSRPSPQPSKPAIKSSETGVSPNTDKKVTFLDTDLAPSSRQLVPGVLLMPDAGRSLTGMNNMFGQQQIGLGRHPQNYAPVPDPITIKYSPQTTAAIAKELLDTGSSPTAEAINKQGVMIGHSVVRPKQQLLYLAEVLGFQVEFTDFPKSGKKSDYLSLVSLSTNPPQVSHGGGQTIDESHDTAALTALKALSVSGLDMMSDQNDSDKMAAGDGLHMNSNLDDLK